MIRKPITAFQKPMTGHGKVTAKRARKATAPRLRGGTATQASHRSAAKVMATNAATTHGRRKRRLCCSAATGRVADGRPFRGCSRFCRLQDIEVEGPHNRDQRRARSDKRQGALVYRPGTSRDPRGAARRPCAGSCVYGRFTVRLAAGPKRSSQPGAFLRASSNACARLSWEARSHFR